MEGSLKRGANVCMYACMYVCYACMYACIWFSSERDNNNNFGQYIYTYENLLESCNLFSNFIHPTA